MPVRGQQVAVGAPDRTEQQPVLHAAAVDEEILMLGAAAGEGRKPRPARQPQALARHGEGHGMGEELLAEDPGDARIRAVGDEIGGGRRQLQHPPPPAFDGKRDARMRHREPAQDVEAGRGFGPLRLEKLAPRGGREEEIAHLDPRAGGKGRRPHGLHAPRLHPDLRALGRIRRARTDDEPGDGADGRQRLAAKAEGCDAREILGAGELGGGVAFDGEC